MQRQCGFAIPAPLIAFFLKYGVWLIVGAIVITSVTVAVKHYNESLRETGRKEIQAKWDADKLARDTKTAELVGQARAEERANQQSIKAGKDKADAENAKLRDDLAAFQRTDGRLRVNRSALCKREPGMPGTTGSGSGNAQAPGSETVGAGAGEINLDDVAREIGRLGGDLDAANIRIAELIGVVNVCQRRR